MPRQRIALIVGGVVALLAVVGGVVLLTGDSDEVETAPATTTEATTSTTEATTTTVAAGPVAPLTGLPAPDPALLPRPALIVKVDNADYQARPQAGLNQADVIVEEQVEGGVTRFATIFHSQDAPQVGPIRSARSTDIAIAGPLGRPLFAFSGANDVFLARIRAANLVDLSYDWHSELYTRVPDRPAPDNIFTPTSTLYSADPGESEPPQPLFTYRAEGDALADTAERVPGVSYAFGGAGVPTAFLWNAEEGGWARFQNGTPHVDTDEVQFTPANVIVQFVDYVDTGLVDLAGTPVPEASLVGEGDVWVLTDGHLVGGRWKRDTLEEPTRFLDADGEPIALTPGQTWVALVPPGRAQYTACADLPADAIGC